MAAVKYPLEVVNGRVALVDQYADIVGQHILAAVNTVVDERVWRPEFGRDLWVFTSVSDLPSILANVREAIRSALETYPDIEYSTLGYISDDGLLYLAVTYQCPDFDPRTLEVRL